MVLPTLGLPNLKDPGVLLAAAIEPFINPLRDVKDNATTLQNISTRLIGINAITPLTSGLIDKVSPFKKKKNNVAAEKTESADMQIKSLLEKNLLSSESNFGIMQDILTDILLVSEAALNADQRIMVQKDRETLITREKEIERGRFQEDQLEQLKKLANNMEGGSGELTLLGGFKSILDGIKTIGIRLLSILGVTKVAGVAASGLTTAFNLTGSLLGKNNKGIIGLAKKLLGPAVLAFEGFQAFQKADETQQKFGNTGNLLGFDTSKFNAAIGEFFGGTSSGTDNALSKAGDLALTGAAVGLAFGPIGAIIGGLAGGLLGAVSGFFGGEEVAKVLGEVQEVFNGIVDKFTMGFKQIGEWAKELFGFVGRTAKNIASTFSDILDFFTVTIPNTFMELKESIVNFDFIGSITESFSAVGTRLKNIFTDLVDSISFFVYDSLSSLGSAGEKVADFLFSDEEIKKFKAISSDSQEAEPQSNPISNFVNAASQVEIPDVVPTFDEAKQMISQFNDSVIQEFRRAKEEAERMMNAAEGGNGQVQPVPIPVPQPIPMGGAGGSSTPVLVAPKPMRNPRTPGRNQTNFIE